jgi:hypothetical protein
LIIPIINKTIPATAIFIDFIFVARKNKTFASRSHIIETISLFSENTKATAKEKREIQIAAIV